MTRRDISLTIALCASLLLHALLVGSAAEVYALRTREHIWLPGFPRLLDPGAIIVTPLPLPDLPDDPMRRLGDSTGTGDALATSAGEAPMLAPKAGQTQAFLSRDPEGPGKVGDEPIDSVFPLGKPGSAAAAPTPAPPAPPPSPPLPEAPDEPAEQVAAVFGMPTTGGDFALPLGPKSKTIPEPQPAPEPAPEPAPAPPPPAPIVPPAPPAAAAPAPAAVEGLPGADRAADPAPKSESESDPFSSVGSVEFRRGATDVRLGRKYKIIRPRLTVAAQADLMSKAKPVVVLKIRIDEQGNVTSVDIYRSSGSNEVDQPCKLAAYKWWFEPAKDAAGKPVKDVILFAIRFM